MVFQISSKNTNKNMVKKFLEKLRTGSGTAIQLNAVPGTSASKLDLCSIDLCIDENQLPGGFSKSFVGTLLSKDVFQIEVPLKYPDLPSGYDDEDEITRKKDDECDEEELLYKKKLKAYGNTIKRFNTLLANSDDIKLEKGVQTFGFGFPLLIKESQMKRGKVIKAPILVWNLGISRSIGKKDTFILSKTEDNWISINEMLISFLAQDENIALNHLSEDILDDGVVDHSELSSLVGDVMKRLGVEINISNDIESLVKKCPTKETLDSKAKAGRTWINWSGVYGIYKSQKGTIIKDTNEVLDNFEELIGGNENEFENMVEESLIYDHHFAGVPTDPSQQRVLNESGETNFKVIQGPPGTGKSQTLTAIITNALDNGKKCLVVCEKRTALDVLNANLEDKGLGSLSAVIEDVRRDRKVLVNDAREIIDGKSSSSSEIISQSDVSDYASLIKKGDQLINGINDYHQFLDKKYLGNKSWSQIIGDYLKLKRENDLTDLSDDLFNELDLSEFEFTDDEKDIIFNSTEKSSKLYKTNFKDSIIKSFKPEFIKLELSSKQLKEKYIKPLIKKGKVASEEIINKELVFRKDYSSYIDFQNIKSEIETSGPYDVLVAGKYGVKLNEILDGIQNFQLFKNFDSAIDEVSHETITKHTSKLRELNDTYLNELNVDREKYKEFFGEQIELIEGGIKIINKNKESNGDDFLIDSIGTNLKLSVGSLFSKRLKGVKKDLSQLSELIDKLGSDLEGSELDAKSVNIDFSNSDRKILLSELEDNKKKLIEMSDGLDRYYEINLANIINLSSDGGILEIIENHYKGLGAEYLQLVNLVAENQVIKLPKLDPNTIQFGDLKNIIEKLSELEKASEEIDDFFCRNSLYQGLDKKYRQVLSLLIKRNEEDQSNWLHIVKLGYLNSLLIENENGYLSKIDCNEELENLQSTLNGIQKYQKSRILSKWNNEQQSSIERFSDVQSFSLKNLYNKRGSKGKRRTSLRNIIKYDFDMFTDFFPVLLMNPESACSILPLKKGLFDLVIFDEASQLRLEDTFSCVLRGKEVIVSGDSHQMPPSDYFSSDKVSVSGVDEDESFEDELITESSEKESLLEYGEDFVSRESQYYLDIHYRSQHPYLIDFSNSAFYKSRLYPIPSQSDYKPIEFYQVDGIYVRDKANGNVNYDEANKILDILVELGSESEPPSVMVATFNIHQRNLILKRIAELKEADNNARESLNRLSNNGLVVRNLDSIQGDEKDVVVIGTTFGKTEDGAFNRRFGKINNKTKGYRYLNVLITRAKKKVYVVTSIPTSEYFSYENYLTGEYPETGFGIFYAYLMYCKAVSDKDDELRKQVLFNISGKNLESKYVLEATNNENLLTESPFEEEVLSYLLEILPKEQIETQYRCGGFRVDIVLKNKQGNPIIAVECDGASFHSSREAYSWDLCRQSQLEGYGLDFIRIRSTERRDQQEKEQEILKEKIEKLM